MESTLNKKQKRKLAKLNKAIKHPLHLPKGSIRAILVLLLTLLLGVCIVIEREVPTDIAIVWVSLVSYYVGHRSSTTPE